MTALLALSVSDMVPIIVFFAIVAGAWFLMSALSRRSSLAEQRLARLGRPQSAAELEELEKKQRFSGLKEDRKSTRLNSSHSQISYAVFCLKKKKKPQYKLLIP